MKRSESIEKICKRHKKEWLLIAVDEMDESITLPLTGHLVAHSPRRGDIDAKLSKDRRELLVCYSAEPLPPGKGYAL